MALLAAHSLAQASMVKKTRMEEPHKTKEPQGQAACEADNVEMAKQTALDVAIQRESDPTKNKEPLKKHVGFDYADVIEFEPSMWTATVSSEGPPLGMSVDVRCRTKRPLDAYENDRVLLRIDRQVYMELGYLEPEERLDILENAGHSISTIGHAERETLRINRERWESNEFDLMYQFVLGEVPRMMDSEMEMEQQDDGDEIMHVDDCCDFDFVYGAGARNSAMDSEVRFVVEDMDIFDAIHTRPYDDLSVVYTSDCILGDDASSDENNELPYAIDTFDCPLSCDFLEMGSSPSDVSSVSDCITKAASYALYTTSSTSSPKEALGSEEATSVGAT